MPGMMADNRMSVTIHIPQFFQHLTNDVKVAIVNEGTVGECLKELVKRFPQLETLLFTKNGKLLKYLDVILMERVPTLRS